MYDDSAYSAPICTDETLTSGGMYDCVVSSSSSGEIWIKVDGSYAYRYLGGSYSVGVYAYFANEGTSQENKSLEYPADIPYSGTVDSRSKYLLSGLEPNTTYITTLTGYDASADMSFTLARAANWAAGCASKETAPGMLSCSLLSHDQGTLAIDVREGDLVLGSPFVLNAVRSEYQSEGTADSPVPVPLTLESYDGQVGGANSYYEITGLTPGLAYTVRLMGLEGRRFYVYDDAAKVVGSGSSYACNGYTSTQCTARAVGTSLWLMVERGFTPTGYTIETVEVPYRSEGSLDEPVRLTYQEPTEGMVDIGESYYRLDGLEPGKDYVVTATGIGTDGTADMYVYDNPATFGSTHYEEYTCQKSLLNDGQTYCATQATSSSLWIMVRGRYSGSGAVYTLNSDEVKEAENQTLDYAGGDFPYAGTTDKVSSRYTVVGVKPYQYYQVSLTNLSADLDLYLGGSLAPCNPALGTADEVCQFTTSSREDFSIVVRGDKTLYGGTFTLGVTAGPENQGTITDPVVLTAQTQLPYNGEVSRNSYYRIAGLLPNTFYAVSMTKLTADADLYLYKNEAFSSTACTSSQTGSAAEVCGATSSSLGEIWVKAVGIAQTGAMFSLDADEGPVREGAKGSEVIIASTALPYSGSVDRSTSYYAITGLEGKREYTFRLTDHAGSLAVRAYKEGSMFADCSSGPAKDTLDCSLTTNPGGNQTIYLEVDGSGSSAGSTYTISLAP